MMAMASIMAKRSAEATDPGWCQEAAPEAVARERSPTPLTLLVEPCRNKFKYKGDVVDVEDIDRE